MRLLAGSTMRRLCPRGTTNGDDITGRMRKALGDAGAYELKKRRAWRWKEGIEGKQ